MSSDPTVKPDAVLSANASTPTPSRVLNQGMTEKEREIFYRLLVDLFVDNPRRKKPQVKEGRAKDDKDISTSESNRPAKLDDSQATTDE